MSYRPITDVWILARPKVKYYGAYPAGFLHRARQLLGVHNEDPVLHVCSGMVKAYPFRGLGPNDQTVDLDPALSPDWLQDVREDLPLPGFWYGILADPPYSEADAEHYVPGAMAFPSASTVLKNCCAAVREGGRVGIIHYEWPRPPKDWREVAVVAVGCGRSQRARWFTVWEHVPESPSSSDSSPKSIEAEE
jgi:hypothetical protein